MKGKSLIPIIDIKKYGGKQVVILDGKIITLGQTLEEVIKKVKKLFLKSHSKRSRFFQPRRP